MRRTPFLAIALTSLLAIAGCGSNSASEEAADTRPLIATTVSPITSIAASIAGDRIRIEGIVPEGTNSHTFEPAPRIAKLLSDADLIFVNGLKLEDPTLELAERNMKSGARIVEIGTQVLPVKDYIYDFSFPKSGGKPNPHLWTDPGYAVKYAMMIRDELTTLVPTDKDYFAKNFETFKAEADALGAAVTLDQKSVPAGNLKLLTYHDAYAYFAKQYGWQIIGALQPGDFSDPSPAEVARIIEQVKTQKVKTIFGSEVFPSAVLEEIGRATGARYESSLRDDDLPGAPGDANHSWLGLMKYNFSTMIKGLGGNPVTIDAIKVSRNIGNAKYPQ